MATFLDESRKLLRLSPSTIRTNEFNWVFSAISDLRSVHHSSHLDLDNIEVLFGAFEMGRLLGRLSERSPDAIVALRDALVTLIVQTIEQTTKFGATATGMAPPSPHHQVMQWMRAVRKRFSDETFAFLTFNYDLVLDVAFIYSQIESTYCFDTVDTAAIPLLKLHGSLNWVACKKCDAVSAINLEPWARSAMVPGHDHVLLRVSEVLPSQVSRCCNERYPATPLLVPPSFDKTSNHSRLHHVWARAAKELSRANRIIIVGYSLPETDAFFRYLFALGTDRGAHIEKVYVLDPDPTGNVRKRFDEIIGAGIRPRFTFLHDDPGRMERLPSLLQSIISTH